MSNNILLLLEPEEDEESNEINNYIDNYSVQMMGESSSSSPFYFSNRNKNLILPDKREQRIIIFETGTYGLNAIGFVITNDAMHSRHQTTMSIDMVRMRMGIRSKWTLVNRPGNSTFSLIGFEKKMYPSTGQYIWSTKLVQLFSVIYV